MNTGRTVMIHLSDIHFVKGIIGTVYDLDKELRNELELDTKWALGELGQIHAILVTGDIAFGAKPEEYQYASDWLRRLAGLLGCPRDRVWVVPGNHDVGWYEIDNNMTVRLVHEKLRTQERSKLNEGLTEFLLDARLGEELLRPLGAYRAFASVFGCDFDRGRLFWEKDLPLNDGSILRVRGLSSTLVSNQDDVEGNMVLGLAPATLTRAPGVAHMVLCHHPLEWFREREDVDSRLTSGARILLFGHKHEQRLRRLDDAVLLTAGAVHPFRRERPWKPRYNYLAVSVLARDTERRLRIEVYPRVWSEESRRFEPEAYQGRPSRVYEFEIEPWTSREPVAFGPGEPGVVAAETRSDPAVVMAIAVEAVGNRPPEPPVMDAALKLADRFWRLPYHIRVKILRQYGLVEEEDKSFPEEERVVLAFRRARERGLLERLAQTVEDYSDRRIGSG